MKESTRYLEIVEWSDEDQCYVGSCPGLLTGGCHGDDERAVFDELCEIVDEVIALYQEDGKPLPPATAGRNYGQKILQVGNFLP
jgi:predicted RNase H-like HicB family nuclease